MVGVRKTVIKNEWQLSGRIGYKIQNFTENFTINKLLSREFNIDTGNVELRYADGSMISIDCTEVVHEFARTINQRSELDWLVYNAPLDYAELVFCGDLEGYLRRVSGPYSGIEGIS